MAPTNFLAGTIIRRAICYNRSMEWPIVAAGVLGIALFATAASLIWIAMDKVKLDGHEFGKHQLRAPKNLAGLERVLHARGLSSSSLLCNDDVLLELANVLDVGVLSEIIRRFSSPVRACLLGARAGNLNLVRIASGLGVADCYLEEAKAVATKEARDLLDAILQERKQTREKSRELSAATSDAPSKEAPDTPDMG